MAPLWIEVAGAASAVLVGVGLGAWLVRRGDRPSVPLDSATAIDADDMEPLIEYAAQRWAAASGRPEAAGLVADKLRTLYRIKYRQPVVPPRRWWWSR